MSNVAAVILAAGVSSRMGQFKPLLEIDGRSMAQRVADSMREAGASPVVMVTGYRADSLEAHLSGQGITFVRNERYFETQMMDSLLLGLSALPEGTTRVLVSPADVPLVKEETIRVLLETEGAFIRPVHEGKGGHPVVLDYALLPSLLQYRGDGGLRGAVAACGVVPVDVPVDDRGVTLDSDTRDEYASLLKYRRQTTQRPLPLQLDLRLGLQAETTFWDAGFAQFLELIQTTGSILNACQRMHMSYSKGWTMINEAERQLGYPILIRNTGGSHGGGSELTDRGIAFLENWTRMQDEIRAQSLETFRKYFPEGVCQFS